LRSNGAGYVGEPYTGSGMVIGQIPSIFEVNGTSTLAIVSSATSARFFDRVGSGYLERFGGQDELSYDATDHQYLLIDSFGDHIRFDDFSENLPILRQGQFASFADPSGHVAAVTSYTSEGDIVDVERGA